MYCEPPPKYEDIIKSPDFRVPIHGDGNWLK